MENYLDEFCDFLCNEKQITNIFQFKEQFLRYYAEKDMKIKNLSNDGIVSGHNSTMDKSDNICDRNNNNTYILPIYTYDNIVNNSIEGDNIYVFTDGSCINNGKKNKAKAGIGVYIPKMNIKISEKLEDTLKEYSFDYTNSTNNRAELMAILKAIDILQEKLKEGISIEIYTDSMYCINCINKWYKNWENNNWKTSQNKDVLNKEIIKQILNYTNKKDYNIKFKYVSSHKEPPEIIDSREYFIWKGNNTADLLAVMAQNS